MLDPVGAFFAPGPPVRRTGEARTKRPFLRLVPDCVSDFLLTIA
jgi:hypothetical protein